MKPNMKDSTQLLITFTTSMAAAIGSCAGATIWQSFGIPKVEEIAEKNSKPKRNIGFSIDLRLEPPAAALFFLPKLIF